MLLATPHDIKGQGIYCYVTLMAGVEGNDELRKVLVGQVRREIGPVASPDKIQFAPGLPKNPIRQNHAAYFAKNCGR